MRVAQAAKRSGGDLLTANGRELPRMICDGGGCLQAGRFRRGALILLIVFGSGLNQASCVIQW